MPITAALWGNILCSPFDPILMACSFRGQGLNNPTLTRGDSCSCTYTPATGVVVVFYPEPIMQYPVTFKFCYFPAANETGCTIQTQSVAGIPGSCTGILGFATDTLTWTPKTDGLNGVIYFTAMNGFTSG